MSDAGADRVNVVFIRCNGNFCPGTGFPRDISPLAKADRELEVLEREIRGPEAAPPAPAAPEKAKRRKTEPPEAAG